jgi:HD domain
MTPNRTLAKRAQKVREIGSAGALERWREAVSVASPGDAAAAIADALKLEACVIFQRYMGNDTSVGAYVREARLEEALRRAYLEHVLSPDSTSRVTSAKSWSKQAGIPSYLDHLLDRGHWVLSIPVRDGDRLFGSVWMLGDRKREEPPTPALRRKVEDIASTALRDALALSVGPETHEVQLLEDVGAALTDQRPIAIRLEDAVTRLATKSGFASVQLITRAPQGVINATWTRDLGLVREPVHLAQQTLAWGRAHFMNRSGPILLAKPAELNGVLDYQRTWMRSNDVQYLFVIPLFFGAELLGVFQICSQYNEEETWRRGKVFIALGSNIAAVLQSVLLVEEVEEARHRLDLSHRNAVRALANAAEARDSFTGGHLARMERYARVLGSKLDLEPERIEGLAMGAVVHDVGKLRIPDAILLKPGRLDEEERTVMQQHSIFGEEILRSSSVPVIALQVARWHHERWDGTGYPDGLAGENIPIEARIVSVADAFDALTSVRPYKQAWPTQRALGELKSQRGYQFDPSIVDSFVALCEEGAVPRPADEPQELLARKAS